MSTYLTLPFSKIQLLVYITGHGFTIHKYVHALAILKALTTPWYIFVDEHIETKKVIKPMIARKYLYRDGMTYCGFQTHRPSGCLCQNPYQNGNL